MKKLTDEFSVSPQIMPVHVTALRAAGFRSIICNRPDGEASDQPAFQEIDVAARANGLEARYLPVAPGRVTDEVAGNFSDLLDEWPKPVLGYCKTGMRSALLWSRTNSPSVRAPLLFAIATVAGFDVKPLQRVGEWFTRLRSH